MIIVSQDKKKVINFDNIQYINIFQNQLWAGNMPNNQLGDFDTVLGTYKSGERAKKVLQEIVRYYAIANMGQVFEMPED